MVVDTRRWWRLASGWSLAMAIGASLSGAGARWRELIVVSLAASAGFTFALFFATSVMPPGPLLGELKLGALSTAVGAWVALAAARLLHVGRFTPKTGWQPRVIARRPPCR